jgi:serine protease Do
MLFCFLGMKIDVRMSQIKKFKKMMKLNGKKILSTFLIAVIGGAVSLGAYRLIDHNRFERYIYEQQQTPVKFANYTAGNGVSGPDLTVAAQKSIHAVVHIKTEYKQKNTYYDEFFGYDPFFDFFRGNPGGAYPIVAAGSGVIISDNGYIVTNNHVVENASKIEVTLNDKRTYEAKVIGNDPSTDLALIKIDEKGLSFLQYGNSDAVQIGEWVMAVGNPYNLTSTVTAGIVSAKARDIQILGTNSAVESFIQTDAAVNPGNSGGALVNVNGELVGINAAIATNTGSYTGYSFAIPSNLVRKIIGDLMEFGEVQRAYMGISFSDLDSKFAQDKGLDVTKGVYVQSVVDGAAADKAGIKPGDLILKIDDIETNSKSELNEIIARHKPADKILVTIKRGSDQSVTEVTLQNREGATGNLKTTPGNAISVLGATFEECTSNQLKPLGLDHGVRVAKLEKGKLAGVGIKVGFIILYINNKEVRTVEDIGNIIAEKNETIQIEGVYPSGMRAYYGFNL